MQGELHENLEKCLRQRWRQKFKKEYKLSEEGLNSFIQKSWPEQVHFFCFSAKDTNEVFVFPFLKVTLTAVNYLFS